MPFHSSIPAGTLPWICAPRFQLVHWSMHIQTFMVTGKEIFTGTKEIDSQRISYTYSYKCTPTRTLTLKCNWTLSDIRATYSLHECARLQFFFTETYTHANTHMIYATYIMQLLRQPSTCMQEPAFWYIGSSANPSVHLSLQVCMQGWGMDSCRQHEPTQTWVHEEMQTDGQTDPQKCNIMKTPAQIHIGWLHKIYCTQEHMQCIYDIYDTSYMRICFFEGFVYCVHALNIVKIC
jgi:hypothetical protein